MGRRAWTEQDIETLRQLVAEGLPHHEIGKLMDRGPYAVSNRCQKLDIRNPEAARRNSAEAQRRIFSDPARRADIGGRISATWTPERRRERAEAMRAININMGWRKPTPEGRRRMSQGCSDWHKRKWAWLPAEYRAEYTRLARDPKIRAAKAKEIMREKIAATKRAPRPKLTFEEQLERVRNGASISIVRPIPRRVEPPYTLGGVSSI